jgi:hypothetical protein
VLADGLVCCLLAEPQKLTGHVDGEFMAARNSNQGQ